MGVFLRQAARFGERTLVRHHDGRSWREVSWHDMRELALKLAAGLVQAGVEVGDRVGLMSPNCLEWLYCDLGIQAAGAVTVPIYATTPVPAAARILADSGARLVLAADRSTVAALASHRALCMDDELAGWVGAPADPGLLTEVERRACALQPDDLCTIVYTSGTTGEPKGVMLAHRCIVDMIRSCLQVFDVGPQDQSLSFLPYAHVFERVNGIYVGIAAGASTWLSRGVDRLIEDLQECRPTVMVSVPRVYEKMHRRVLALLAEAPVWRRWLVRWALAEGRRRLQGRPSPLFGLADRLVLSQLRDRLTGGRLRFFVSGGAPLSREVEEFFWAFGVKILNGWGLTETSSGATSNTEQAHRFETVGRPLPGVALRIAEDGEVLVKSPGNMLGYFGDPEATAETLVEGWVRTGDIGELDPDGFLRITDRKKDLIKTSGGKFVAPQPLEARLQEHPLIERAVVVGEGRPYVVALVLPAWEELKRATGLSGSPQQLVEDERVRATVQRCVDEVNRGLGSWETIKAFALVTHDFSEEAGELTPTLKVKRRAVQERYRDLIDALYAAPASRSR